MKSNSVIQAYKL